MNYIEAKFRVFSEEHTIQRKDGAWIDQCVIEKDIQCLIPQIKWGLLPVCKGDQSQGKTAI